MTICDTRCRCILSVAKVVVISVILLFADHSGLASAEQCYESYYMRNIVRDFL